MVGMFGSGQLYPSNEAIEAGSCGMLSDVHTLWG